MNRYDTACSTPAASTYRFVWWPAREGTYIREAKDATRSYGYMLEFIDTMLEYDKNIRILGEMKPNEPMDLMYAPTTGHFLALAYKSRDPKRVGVLIESAHAILANLDPSDEMAYAIFHDKLWGVHLNDQNGLNGPNGLKRRPGARRSRSGSGASPPSTSIRSISIQATAS